MFAKVSKILALNLFDISCSSRCVLLQVVVILESSRRKISVKSFISMKS